MRIEASHYFDVPVERGFAFITATANWSKFWPGFVRIVEGSRWMATGDTARLVTRLLGQERELTMVMTAYHQNRLTTYTSTQRGLPRAYHERHFERDGRGFVYRLVVEYEPQRGVLGVVDRVLLARGVRAALDSTLAALDRELPMFSRDLSTHPWYRSRSGTSRRVIHSPSTRPDAGWTLGKPPLRLDCARRGGQ